MLVTVMTFHLKLTLRPLDLRGQISGEAIDYIRHGSGPYCPTEVEQFIKAVEA